MMKSTDLSKTKILTVLWLTMMDMLLLMSMVLLSSCVGVSRNV